VSPSQLDWYMTRARGMVFSLEPGGVPKVLRTVPFVRTKYYSCLWYDGTKGARQIVCMGYPTACIRIRATQVLVGQDIYGFSNATVTPGGGSPNRRFIFWLVPEVRDPAREIVKAELIG